MTRILASAAIIALCLLPAEGRAQSPDEITQTIATQGGAYAGCIRSVVAREDPALDPFAVNPISGAFGVLQYLQTGGVWEETPDGQAGIAVTVTSVAEQIAMAAWALANGFGSAWAPLPFPACSGA